jgi:hypothetical protein
MPEPSLVVICGVAFLAVFCVLTGLAAAMRILTLVFPELEESIDSIEPAVIAAITEGVKAAYPGTRVSQIEEVK